MMEMEHMDIRLEPSLRQQLAALAEETDRNEEELVGEAIANYLDLQAWQRERIKQAIAAADRGEFAPPEDVERVFTTYKPQSR
jgi:predicted transcriptional regulator